MLKSIRDRVEKLFPAERLCDSAEKHRCWKAPSSHRATGWEFHLASQCQPFFVNGQECVQYTANSQVCSLPAWVIFNLGVSVYIYIYVCVCACSMQGQSKHHHGEIHYHYLKKYDSNFTVVYFLGIQWWQGMEKSLVCGMGTNFSPGILLTCFFVVGQQSCVSIVLQKR